MTKKLRAFKSRLVRLLSRRIAAAVSVHRNRIVFSSDNKGGFGCNPKYIALALKEIDPSLDLIWLTDKRTTIASNVEGLRVIGRGKIMQAIAIGSASIWVANTLLPFHHFVKKANQTYCQTFHGSYGLKKIGYDLSRNQLTDKNWRDSKRKYNRLAETADIILSDSIVEKKRFARAYGLSLERIHITGHPRNDVFTRPHKPLQDVRTVLGIKPNQKILLFAPTRGYDFWPPPPPELGLAFEERFGGQWVTVVRTHYQDGRTSRSSLNANGQLVEDAQELLLACDAVVTDFSSIAFDFIHTRKPCFAMLPLELSSDFKKWFYEKADFYPIPFCESWIELMLQVSSFDKKQYDHDVQNFMSVVAPRCDGKSAERAARLIIAEHRKKWRK